GTTAMALDNLGQRLRVARLAWPLAVVLLVRRELRQLQQDLRCAWRRHRLHGLDVALDRGDPDRSRVEFRDGASDGTRYHGAGRRPARNPGRRDGAQP